MSPLKLSVFLAVSLLLTLTAEGQTTPSCGQSLVPCANYLNATNPPSSCCDPLKDAIKTQLTCLCNIYNTPGFLSSLGINVTEAVTLPARCKLSGGLNSCVKGNTCLASICCRDNNMNDPRG